MTVRRTRRTGRSTHRSVGLGAAGRGLAALLTLVALALGGVLLASPGAVATESSPSAEATSDTSKIRWAVKPADSEGADGRSRIETSADPGATIQEHMAVKNLGDVEVTFALSSADGFFNRNGRFDMLTADKESVDAGTWIELPESVTVAAHKTVVVPFTIAVPESAAAGDHQAGVAASILSDTGSVDVISRVGFRVAVTVSGEVTPGLDLQVTDAEYHTSWNPFSPGTLEITFTLANDGNVSLGGSGVVTASGPFGLLSSQSEFEIKDVAPGQSVEGSVVVEGVWPVVRDTADVVLTPSQLAGAGDVSQPRLERSLGFWALPWPQLALLALLVLVVVGVRTLSAWRRRRLESRLDRLVEARLSAAAATPGPSTEPPMTRRSARQGPDRRSTGSTQSGRDESAPSDSEQDPVDA